MLETLKPPLDASLLLSLFGHEPDFSEVVGDLQEEFQQLSLQSGVEAAQQWYRREALRNVLVFVSRRSSINVFGSAVFCIALFRLVIPQVHHLLRYELVLLPRVPGLGLVLLTLFEIAVSFLLGTLVSWILRGREPLLRLTFTMFYLVSVVSFVFRSGMFEWWTPVQFSSNVLGLICVVASFWIGSLCSERNQPRQLS